MMNRQQMVRFAAFVTVLAVLLGYVVYHRAAPEVSVGGANHPATSATSKTKTAASTATNTSASTQLQNYFENFRTNRDRMMSQSIATLKNLMNNTQVSQASKSQAMATVLQDEQELKQETSIEGLLSSQGFPLTAVTLTSNSCVVVVGQAKLTQQQVARIANTAMQVTHLSPEDIVIMPKASA